MPTNPDRRLIVEGEKVLRVLRALDSETRLLMLSSLSNTVLNVTKLSETLDLPQSTVSFHIKQLESAGLLQVEYMPGSRGSQKLIGKRYDEIVIRLPGAVLETPNEPDVVEVSMPVGTYSTIQAQPTCGLASAEKIIGMLDDPRSFFEPEHVFAQILWFRAGFVEYGFPNNVPYGAEASELEISAEICSEAPQHDPEWPSDITLWVNQTELGTWTSPGDLGGVPSKLTPPWWALDQTTHGLLKKWRVTGEGTYIDGEPLSRTRVADLGLERSNQVLVRFGIKPDARHVGGLNLFGRGFGNYPQDLLLRIRFAYRANEQQKKF